MIFSSGNRSTKAAEQYINKSTDQDVIWQSAEADGEQ